MIIKPSTLLCVHSALKKRKYQQLYSPSGGGKPGPKGPSREVIKAIVEMKQRNPHFGCPRIAQQINLAFGLDLDKDTVRRVLATPLAERQITGRMVMIASSQMDLGGENIAP